ncbi:DMT family transporter [Catellatospora sp. KI3]|uniref:DMT family transporter n=1 Tax=Catellatospora sp. KI3 TaxID=3041620 RepID=UPI0024822CD1|nr:DMT family transporter [Catellatospora sp. KI3]MDI1465859.1 DMT family transporter [Catellatospora sp. KI3]
MNLASIALGVLAAALFAAAAALQHRVTSAQRDRPADGWLPVLAVVPGLLRHRVWLAGFCCNVLGFAVHAAALHTGSISIVQALLSVQLLLALPLAAARTGRPPAPRDWWGTLAVVAGLVTLVLARGSVPQTVRHGRVPLVLLTAVLLVAALMVAVRGRLGRIARTAAVGVAAGIGFSTTAVLTVVVTDELARGGPAAVPRHWPLYALALSGLVAALLVQEAFRSGALPAALTAMTVADPVFSWVWGAVLFDAAPPTSLSALSALTASGVAIASGVATLAFSPTLAPPADTPAALEHNANSR